MNETRTDKAEVIDYVLDELKITDKSKVVIVGDREHDVIGAAAHGMDCIGVLFGYGSEDELQGAGAISLAADAQMLSALLL